MGLGLIVATHKPREASSLSNTARISSTLWESVWSSRPWASTVAAVSLIWAACRSWRPGRRLLGVVSPEATAGSRPFLASPRFSPRLLELLTGLSGSMSHPGLQSAGQRKWKVVVSSKTGSNVPGTVLVLYSSDNAASGWETPGGLGQQCTTTYGSRHPPLFQSLLKRSVARSTFTVRRPWEGSDEDCEEPLLGSSSSSSPSGSHW
mmetsp:Transcript_78575/g.168372  ORF Transcript_78575/g.168372 Transcript_78575/m.168372 type:complete len:206 (+) Transcript_78575:265-882(+)